MRAPRHLLHACLAALIGCLVSPMAQGQQPIPFPPEQEETYIREELNRIINEDPPNRANAERVLTELDQPEASPVGRQLRSRRERGARRIVNGLPSGAYPAVAAILKGENLSRARMWCTGTLIACDKVLTAAHCLEEQTNQMDDNPKHYHVFFQEHGFLKLKAIDWPKGEYKFPYFDLAVLTLETPVEGIAPMSLHWGKKPRENIVASIVGFGRTGGSRLDYGIKREGTVLTAQCTGEYAELPLLCWKFDADTVWRASAQNTCNGDSGGGVFLRDREGDRVVEKLFAVVSGGRDDDCMKNDLSYNAQVARFRNWIEAAAEGRMTSAMCGTPLYTRRSEQPRHTTVVLGKTKSEVVVSLPVPADIQELRVAMNAGDNGDGGNAYELALSHREGGLKAPCEGSGQFAMCKLPKPNAGDWLITAKRVNGEGQVQLTAVMRR
jgi:hypothetical protein